VPGLETEQNKIYDAVRGADGATTKGEQELPPRTGGG